MSEIAKCRCGARDTGIDNDDGWAVTCNDCGCRGPFVPTYEEAIAAWNALMRPRPVARWEWRSGTYAHAQYLSCGHVDFGYVMWKRAWVAYCAVTDEESGPMMLKDARAWLEERVKAAGFEVREEVSDE